MITKYTKKDGSTAYKLQAYLGVDKSTGKQVRTTRQGFKTIKEAKRVEVKLIEDFNRQGVWKNNDKTTFDEVAQLWLEQYANTVKASTYLTTLNYYNSKIATTIGHLPIAKITILKLQKLVNDLSKWSCYGLYISIINRIFKYAVNLGMLDTNPMDKTIRAKIKHVPKSEQIENYYTKDELLTFLEAVKNQESIELFAFYRLLSFGGLRFGEAVALNDADFDFKNKTVSITKTIANTKNGLVIQKPKTKKSIREISLDDETMRIIKSYINQSIKPLHGPFRLFNITANGAIYRLDKIIKKNNFKRITHHGFRHTHASLLFEAGVPAKLTQQRLGHAKISITLDLYTHLSKTQKDEVANKFVDFIAI